MQPSAIIGDDKNQEWYVEKILQTRTKRIGRGTRKGALVKWTGYILPIWKPIVNITDTTAYENYTQNSNKS